MLLPPAGVEGAAAGAPGCPAGFHHGHGGVQGGTLGLQGAGLPSGVERRAAPPPHLPSSSGPAPPQTAGMLCGKPPFFRCLLSPFLPVSPLPPPHLPVSPLFMCLFSPSFHSHICPVLVSFLSAHSPCSSRLPSLLASFLAHSFCTFLP